ncbi:MAG: glutathione S-transferase family protein [Betaproteobacteria bacterium]|nr:glutathione S-transferase family protein [Betaproteobacteria bacterium]
MSTKLYYAAGASSFVPHTLLELAGIDFEPVNVRLHKGEQESPEYLAINPRGQVPALVDGNEVITEIIAIIFHIDARFPEKGFIPKEPLARTRFVETLAWMNNTVHPTFVHIFRPYKFSDDETAQAAMKRHATGQYRKLLEELQALAAKARAAGNDWLGGASCGPLDTYALALLRWGTLAGINPEDYPVLWAHARRTAEVPAVARVIERERLKLSMYQQA